MPGEITTGTKYTIYLPIAIPAFTLQSVSVAVALRKIRIAKLRHLIFYRAKDLSSFFIGPAVLLLLSFACVALLYF
jgi:hypothetical protein